MKIRCMHCKKVMWGSECFAYMVGCLIRMYGEALASLIIQIARVRFTGLTRGFWDRSLAGWVNGFQVPCPQCKIVDSWQDGTIRVKKEKRLLKRLVGLKQGMLCKRDGLGW